MPLPNVSDKVNKLKGKGFKDRAAAAIALADSFRKKPQKTQRQQGQQKPLRKGQVNQPTRPAGVIVKGQPKKIKLNKLRDQLA